MSDPTTDERLIAAFDAVSDITEWASKPEIYLQGRKTLHELRLLMQMMDCSIPNPKDADMTADELFDMGVKLDLAAAEFRRQLNAKQPRTTREDWMAWDCLKGAAAHLRSAAVHMSAHEEKHAS